MAERVELAAGDVGGRVGRQRLGVERDREARLLDQPRGGQAHHAGADHRDRAAMARQAELDREPRRAPGQGDARAAMAVIVDEALVAQRLGADDEARGAIGAQAGEGADDALGRDVDRRQAALPRRRPRHRRRAARKQQRRGGGAEEGAAVHARAVASVRHSSESWNSSGRLVDPATYAARQRDGPRLSTRRRG